MQSLVNFFAILVQLWSIPRHLLTFQPADCCHGWTWAVCNYLQGRSGPFFRHSSFLFFYYRQVNWFLNIFLKQVSNIFCLEILTNSHFSFDWSREFTKNNLFIYYNFALSIFYWFKMFLTIIKFALLDRLSSVLFVCLFAFKLQIKFQKSYSKWDRSQIFILLYYSVCSVFHFSYLWNSGNFKCSASIANHQWLY